jgi:hypothetical protein
MLPAGHEHPKWLDAQPNYGPDHIRAEELMKLADRVIYVIYNQAEVADWIVPARFGFRFESFPGEADQKLTPDPGAMVVASLVPNRYRGTRNLLLLGCRAHAHSGRCVESRQPPESQL